MKRLPFAALACTLLLACGDGQEAPPRSVGGAGPGAAATSAVPLQTWMKANAVPALASRDPARLGRAFERIAELAPSGYAGWAEAARDAAVAARSGDIEACRAACQACHVAHRPRYRAERGADRLP